VNCHLVAQIKIHHREPIPELGQSLKDLAGVAAIMD